MDELNQESSTEEHKSDPVEEPNKAPFPDASEILLVVEQERDDYKDRMQRAQAEFVNFKRRNADEKVEIVKKEKVRVVSTLLPVLDDFELAMNQPERLIADPTWAAGIELIYRKLESILSNQGVSALTISEGAIFDPLLHEGITYQTYPKYTEGQIVQVLRRGYTLDDKLLRAAQVSVAHTPNPEIESNIEDRE
jgi:molecular chaperone GrpE